MIERLTVKITGDSEDQNDVRLGEFIETLEAVKSALKHTERLVRGKAGRATYYRVVNLRHDSPATIELEPVAIPGEGESPVAARQSADEGIVRFITSIEAILKNETPPGLDVRALGAFRDLGDVLVKNVSEVEFHSRKAAVAIDRNFRRKVDDILGRDEEVDGSIMGILEKLNLHNTARFDIYPAIGPSHVTCEFPKELRDDVVRAVDRLVEVTGTLKYKELSRFPYAIKVKQLEVMPLESELPTLRSLRGLAPNATGDLTAAEFVYELRRGQ